MEKAPVAESDIVDGGRGEVKYEYSRGMLINAVVAG
jgi:hypothetical protein